MVQDRAQNSGGHQTQAVETLGRLPVGKEGLSPCHPTDARPRLLRLCAPSLGLPDARRVPLRARDRCGSSRHTGDVSPSPRVEGDFVAVLGFIFKEGMCDVSHK